MILIDELVPTN